MRKGWDLELFNLEKTERGSHNCLSKVQESSQWGWATAEGTMGRNWKTGSSILTQGWISSLPEWQSTGIGCPQRLWTLLLKRYSRLLGINCAACCRASALKGDWAQWSLEVPSSSYNSVILWFWYLCIYIYTYSLTTSNVYWLQSGFLWNKVIHRTCNDSVA